MKVLFLGCNYDQLPYLEYLSKRDIQVIGTDINPSAVGRDLCWKFINSGYENYKEIIKQLELIGFRNNDKIFTASAQFAYYGAAKIAKHFCVKFPSVEAIQAILDKSVFYKNFKQLGVSIPKTCYVSDNDELHNSLRNFDTNCYLKSDRSKNPKYIYQIKYNEELPEINWKKDTFLQKFYILQEEISGQAIRINFADDKFFVFDFETSEFNHAMTEELNQSIKEDVLKIINFYGITDWIVKFDVIIKDKNSYAFLDIGIDPPMRLLNQIKNNGHPFEEIYCDKYIFNKKLSLDQYV